MQFVEFVEFVGLIKTETLRDTIGTDGDSLRLAEIQWREWELEIGGRENDAQG